MFERYTEQSRRVLFFARDESIKLGHVSIETEHLLLGLLRENERLTSRIFAQRQLTLEDARHEIEVRRPAGEKVPASVEIPFHSDTKRALQSAAEEADRLTHRHIGPEHLQEVFGFNRNVSELD